MSLMDSKALKIGLGAIQGFATGGPAGAVVGGLGGATGGDSPIGRALSMYKLGSGISGDLSKGVQQASDNAFAGSASNSVDMINQGAKIPESPFSPASLGSNSISRRLQYGF